MRLLLVEDEEALQQQLHDALQNAGFAVDCAGDGEEGLYFALEYPLDLAIVDIGLPKLNGIELIRKLRSEGRNYPVLILTARDSWQDKVEGLEAGADDYLVKPFHVEELLARLNALLRRVAGAAQPVLERGPIVIDTRAKRVSVAGNSISLTAYEYKVLEYLVMKPDTVISKMELSEHIYDEDFDRDSNVIEVFVGRLRRKLDPDGSYKPIETLRGQGYRFTILAEKA